MRIEPLTAERWDDLVALFGPSGAYSGCWCTWWRLSSKEFDAVGAEARRERLRARAGQEPPPGLLAYGVNDPGAVGWVSVAPVEEFPRILRSRTIGPGDPTGVWSINCFFIGKAARGQGVATALLEAAVSFAEQHGATAVEAYPVDPEGRRAPELYTGTVDQFRRVGFERTRGPDAVRVRMRKVLRTAT